ncbi:FMN reductase [Allorhizobium undicola]|uniref:FMN reductase n=1 Tax=Allorhizobium undicola TaxID=78527 RepID=UPI003D34809B
MCVVIIAGSVSNPSRTVELVRAIAHQIASVIAVDIQHVELSAAAPVLFRALRADQLDAEGREIIKAIEEADVLVVGSPVYRASYTGALKHLFELVDHRALTGKRVLLAATGGTPLHGLMIDHQLRPMFAFFNALTVPTSVYATTTDFSGHQLENPEVQTRIERAVGELVTLLPAAVHRPSLIPSSTIPAHA